MIDINYAPQYPGSTNFDDVVKPLLLSYPNPITVYAGDLGATDPVSPFMYDRFENITLIGSGMGGGIQDNIIITDVYDDSIHFNLVAINGEDPNRLGDLTDHIISSANVPITENDVQLYPNPCKTHFFVDNDTHGNLMLSIHDVFGRIVENEVAISGNTTEIRISELTPGMYIVRLSGKQTGIAKKLVVE